MKSKEDILKLERTLSKLENLNASFDYLRLSIASPKRIKSWSERILPDGEIVGEVVKAETINFRTHQPELGGLFCEKIFGPIKNWKCKCGKYNGFVLDKICEECKVEIIEARVRRYRMGYIDLTAPVTHLWYLKGNPSYLTILLRLFDIDLSVSKLEDVVYMRDGTKIPSGLEPFVYYNNTFLNNAIGDGSWLKTRKKYQRRVGAEILKAALESINLKSEINNIRSFLSESIFSKKAFEEYKDFKTIVRQLRILESFLATKTNPSWMILTTLPVLPPNLRPLLELDNGRLIAADVNEIYRLIITRNQRLSDFIFQYVAPPLITMHSRRLLQESVDSLIDNAKLKKDKKFCLNNKPLKSLTEILEGKQGRFRQTLLGKRVDYSGRSVIVVGPNLRLNQCGIPYKMARELFQPFLINELLKTKIKPPSHNTKLAHIIIKKNKPFVWMLLKKLTRKYSIILNRAPTLHRFGIQAFDPVLVLGQAVHLHPLVCTGFNADFDGDQMAVHLPLYEASQLEARTMMRPSYNVISPSNGDVILKPTQDMVIGSYYLTLMIKKKRSILQKWFANEKEALLAFYQKKVTLHTSILVRYAMNSFKIQIKDKTVKFLDTTSFLDVNDRELTIYKIFQLKTNVNKYYLITNIGILIARHVCMNNYKLTDLFLETTPGRLIFSINFKNSIQN
jgi:DNA-directed RNA polymerase subunit beta'